jgi:hypothetical protein
MLQKRSSSELGLGMASQTRWNARNDAAAGSVAKFIFEPFSGWHDVMKSFEIGHVVNARSADTSLVT